MVDAAFWGLIQGLTEFLPVSSSGHLVLVPEVLGRDGPDLGTSAVLHLGTLAAVLVYFRREVGEVVRLTETGRRLLRLLVIGTIPAALLGFTLRSQFEKINDTPWAVAMALFVAGAVLVLTARLKRGERRVSDVSSRDAALIGLSQALALIPGVTRSGMTIGAGVSRSLDLYEAARFSFLLGIPAIAGAGLFEFVDLAREDGGIDAETLVGVAVAAVAGYAAIAFLLRVIRRAGLAPFGIYCMLAGAVAFALVV
jgi:undecaprenyl-diphosphatase